MPWQKYDPAHPPKAGQKARCKNYGEITLPDAGRRLIEGCSIASLLNKDWEVFWDGCVERPAVGTFVKVNNTCLYPKEWVGSIGKVVAHEGSSGAFIDWISGNRKGVKYDHWNFPNSNLDVADDPNPKTVKVEVGQTWKHRNGWTFKILTIKDGILDVETVSGGLFTDPGQITKTWGNVSSLSDTDIFSLVDTKPTKKVGDLFRDATNGTVVEITNVQDDWCDAKVLFVGSSGYQQGEMRPKFGRVSSDWIYWKKMSPPKVGEVYRTTDKYREHKTTFEITAIEANGHITAKILQSTIWGAGGVITHFTATRDNGYQAFHWQLDETYIKEEKPVQSSPKVEVGQIYQWHGSLYQITKVVSGGFSGEHLDASGRHTSGGISSPLNEHGCPIDADFKLITNYRPEKAAVGQVYRNKTSEQVVKITKIVGKTIDAIVLETGNGMSSGKKGQERLSFGSTDDKGSISHWSSWDYLPNYQEERKVEVGQVWRLGGGHGWTFKITEIKDDKISVQTLESGKAIYKVGIIQPNIFNVSGLVGATNYEIVENYVAPKPKVQVGQVYAYDGWVVRITEVSNAACAAETLEQGYSAYKVGTKHSYWGNIKDDGTLTAEHFKLVENYVEKVAPSPNAVKIGQVWRDTSGWTVRITNIDLTQCGAETIETGTQKHSPVGEKFGLWGYLRADGTLTATNWNLVENYQEQKIADKVEVGQVWKDKGRCVAKITDIRGGIAFATILEQGASVYPVGKNVAWKDVIYGKFRNPDTWVRQDNYVEKKPEIKVGQIWTYHSGLQVQVVKITSSYAGVKVLNRGASGWATDEIIPEYASLDGKGRTETLERLKDSSRWTLTQDAVRDKPKVGEVYAQKDGWQVRITDIHGNTCSGQTIKAGTTGAQFAVGTNHSCLDYLDDGKMPTSWTLVEAAPQTAPEPAPVKSMTKVKVGQVWTQELGCTIRIVKVGNGAASHKVLKRGSSVWADGDIVDSYISLNEDGTAKDFFGQPDWKLTTQVPTNLSERSRTKAGEVYRRGDEIVKVIENREPTVEVEIIAGGVLGKKKSYSTFGGGRMNTDWELIEEAPEYPAAPAKFKIGDRVQHKTWNEAGKLWVGTVVNVDDKYVGVQFDQHGKYSPGDKHTANIQDLIAEPTETAVKVGQVWKCSDGWTVKITEVNGRAVKSKCLEVGSSGHEIGKEYHWTGWLTDGKPSKQWFQVDNYVEKTSMKAKVGQVWADGDRKVRIVGIAGNKADVEYLESWGSYKVGYKHESFFNQALTMEAYTSWRQLPVPGDRVDVKIDIGDKETVSGIYLGDFGAEKDVVYLDKAVDFGSNASWTAHEPIAAAAKQLGVKVSGRRCWQVVPGQSKITKVFEKEGEVMGNEKKDEKETFGAMFKQDLTDAAWRAGATTMTTAVKTAILAMLKDKGADESRLSLAKEMMESEFGSILVRAALGYGLTYAPMISEDPRAQKLAKEFRVSAMDSGMDQVMGIGMQYLMPAVQGALSALPPIETAVPEMLRKKKRVAAAADDSVDEEEDIEEEKTSTANAG